MPLHEVSAGLGESLHGCRIYNSTTQSIGNSADTLATFDSEEFDTDGYHSTASNTSRITIPAGLGGYYHVGFIVLWADNATGLRIGRILKTGASVRASQVTTFPNAGGNTPHISYETIISLAAGDYVEVNLFQTSGGSLATGSATDRIQNGFWAHFVGT